MATTTWTTVVDDDGLAVILTPRDDLVRERAAGPRRFTLDHGPFASYDRSIEVRDLDDGQRAVTQRIEFRLAPGVVPIPFRTLYRFGLRRRDTSPWWAPPDRLDTEAASTLGLIAIASLILGYVASLATQTLTYAADEFGASKHAQGDAFAAMRIGVLLAVVLTSLADRHGRKRLLVISMAMSIVATALGALAPSLFALSATQTIARGADSALFVIIAIIAAEAMPAGSRAFAISLLTMVGALGAGICLWILPVADRLDRGWRVLYLVPLLSLPLLASIARRLPESRRYQAPHVDSGLAGHGRRFWILAASGFLLAVFTAPASQFQNEYLRDERGYSGAMISLFIIATNTPGALGIIIGGRIADLRGRRGVAAIAVIVGTLGTVGMFVVGGWTMWAWSIAAALVGSAAVPALGVYGPELFPTSLRGRANGILTVLGVCGSVVGLVAVGRLAESFDGFGPALAIMAIGPLLMAVLVLVAYPETAHRELEDLNPEDRRPDDTGAFSGEGTAGTLADRA